MEAAADPGNYLPLSFKSLKRGEYITFLWDAFESNYTHGKYQFAFLGYHMLAMRCVYFNIWQIKQTRPEDFEKGLIGFARDEKALLEATLHHRRCYALAESQALRFSPKLTVVRRDNAAGKTVYIRIPKSTCSALGDQRPPPTRVSQGR